MAEDQQEEQDLVIRLDRWPASAEAMSREMTATSVAVSSLLTAEAASTTAAWLSSFSLSSLMTVRMASASLTKDAVA